MREKPATRLHVIWMLRDARGLSGGELNFLYTIESRRISYASKATLKDDMGGIAETTFQRRKQSVIDKNLVRHEYRDYETTVFEVNEKVLSTYVPWDTLVKYVPAAVLATYPPSKSGRGLPQNEGEGDTHSEGEGIPDLMEGAPSF